MAGLPHYRNSQAAINHWEPVYNAMFELTLFSPTELSPILIEHVKSISGLDDLNPSVTTTEQKYKQATRSYAGFPEKTTLDLTVVFTMNLDDSNENYVYTSLRRWRNKIWDPLTGASGMKKDYCGSGVIVQFNRDGSVYRKIILKDVFPTGNLTGMGELSYENSEAAEITLNLRSDYWDEQLIGI